MLHRQYDENDTEESLDFVWLELTNQCNLQCIHCYSESSPWTESKDILTTDNYLNIIESAAKLGCHKIQFIGGEPTLNKDLPQFIEAARHANYSFIEVYTNLMHLSDFLFQCLVNNGVAVATSIYSHNAVTHDRITKKEGSHNRTLKNIDRLLKASLDVRAGMIVMDENRQDVDETLNFLKSRGVEKCGTDRVRKFGRGDLSSEHDSSLEELCGSCWRGSVCVAPDGRVSPCIMSKDWSVGSVLEESFEEIVYSKNLKKIRSRIYNEVWVPVTAKHEVNAQNTDCDPACNPNCVPSCNPQCSPNCSPCYPYGKCDPILFG